MERLAHEVVDLQQLVVVVVVQVDVDDLLLSYTEHELHILLLLLDELVELVEPDHELHERIEVHEQQVNQ